MLLPRSTEVHQTQPEQVLHDLNHPLRLAIGLWVIGYTKPGIRAKLSLERSPEGGGEPGASHLSFPPLLFSPSSSPSSTFPSLALSSFASPSSASSSSASSSSPFRSLINEQKRKKSEGVNEDGDGNEIGDGDEDKDVDSEYAEEDESEQEEDIYGNDSVTMVNQRGLVCK